MDCKGCNAYYVGETRKILKSRIRQHQGAVRRRETTSLIWMHTAETGHSFDFENSKAIDHGGFKRGTLSERSTAFGTTSSKSMRLAPGTIPSDPDKDQSQGSSTDSSRGPTRSTYGPTGGRCTHTRTELHGANNARPSTVDGPGRTNTRQPSSFLIN